METSLSGNSLADEGYVYFTYGHLKYLKHAVASVETLRRYDKQRPVVLYCSDSHQEILQEMGLADEFSQLIKLPEENQSITGFKHNIYKFSTFKKTLFLDSDILWCKNPDNLWKQFDAYPFTITGNQKSDLFFGAPKGFRVLKDIILRRRKRTLKHFGLTYLSRVQSGIIFSRDTELAKKVCVLAEQILRRHDETHFSSRKAELGRDEESCEWSFAMAMSQLNLQVFPWLNGFESPQLDFIESFTEYDEDFKNVKCLLYGDQFVYDLKGLKNRSLQKFFLNILTSIPGKGDHLYVTPYCLHFGWYHQKKPLEDFSERCWEQKVQGK